MTYCQIHSHKDDIKSRHYGIEMKSQNYDLSQNLQKVQIYDLKSPTYDIRPFFKSHFYDLACQNYDLLAYVAIYLII